MKNFNWEAFKRGDIAVHCNTEEKAKDFLKECDREGITWQRGQYTHEFTKWDIFKEGTSYSFFINGIAITRLDLDKTQGYKIIEWEIDTMKELTFTEVMANIKEGQVWECTREDARLKKIHIEKGSINFIYKDGLGMEVFGVKETDTFTLHRKEYTFQEAFKAYEEGKEIESAFNGSKYKKRDGKDEWCRNSFETYIYNNIGFVGFSLNEIRGAWYIND